jgi:hypothetical protein
MARIGTVLAVVFAVAALAPGFASAEEASTSGRVSATYKGLTSAVTQERELDFRVRRDDGQVITGPVQIKGLDGFTGGDLGDVDWQVSGSNVTGALTKNGRRVVTFTGTIGATEASGIFRTLDGRTGSWTAPTQAASQ